MQKRSTLLVVSAAAWLFLGLGLKPLLALAADSEVAPQAHHFNGKYLLKMGSDLGRVTVSPLHWKGKDFAALGVATGVTVGAFLLDHTTRKWVEDQNETDSDNVSLFVTHLGEAPFLVGLSVLLYTGGEAFKNDGLRKTGLMTLESFAISGVIVTGLKLIAGRHRPLAGHGPLDFHFFSTLNHEHSFPSGHSTSAFAVAAVIAGESDSFLVGAFSYALASAVAISRVENEEHWFSDIIVGSALGYFIGKKVLALNRDSEPGKPSLGFGMAPGGFSLSLRF